VQVLKPLPGPYRERELRDRIGAAMHAYKNGLPAQPLDAPRTTMLHASIAGRSARRMRAAGIAEDIAADTT